MHSHNNFAFTFCIYKTIIFRFSYINYTLFIFFLQKPKNGTDCGLFAIANAVAIASGMSPEMQEYDLKKMRPHLLQCLEEKKMTPFPVTHRSCRRKVTSHQKIAIFCHCRKPWRRGDDAFLIQCDKCREWFHSSCETVPSTQDFSSLCWTCTDCK